MKESDAGIYGFMTQTRYGKTLVAAVGDDIKAVLGKRKGMRRREVIDGVLRARGLDAEKNDRLKLQVFDVLEFFVVSGKAVKRVDEDGRAWFFRG